MGLLAPLRRVFGRRSPAPPPDYDPADPALVVVADAPDPAVADSAVLAAAAARGVDVDRHLLVRHRVVGLTGDRAAFQAQLDPSYAVSWDGADALVTRTEVVSAMSLSRERSRMAGLAQRFGGDVAGYDLLAPGAGGPSVGSGP